MKDAILLRYQVSPTLSTNLAWFQSNPGRPFVDVERWF